MNKADVIKQMSEKTRLSASTCKECLDAFIDVVGNSLKKGTQVALTGFGTFEIVERKKRVGVNPATGKKMTIPARRVPKFKAGKALKDLVR